MSLLKRTIRQSMQGVQIPQVTSLSQGQRMLQRMVLLCMQQANDDGRPVVRTAIAVEIGALIRLLPIYLSTTRNAFSISQTIQAVALSGMLSIEQKLDAPAIESTHRYACRVHGHRGRAERMERWGGDKLS